MSGPSLTEVHIPLRTHSQVHGKRCHWSIAAKERRQERSISAMFLRQQQAPVLPCVVTLVRISPRELDSDNIRSSLKAPRDEVAIWLGLPRTKRGQADDRDPRVAWMYQQGHGDKFKVIVIAESVPQTTVDELRAKEEYRP